MSKIKLHFIINARNSDVFYITNDTDKYDKTLKVFDVIEEFDDNISLLEAINKTYDKYTLSNKFKKEDILFKREIYFDLWRVFFNDSLIEDMYLSELYDILFTFI